MAAKPTCKLLAANAPCQLDVLWHDGHTAGQSKAGQGSEVPVFNQSINQCYTSVG
jgi:hypothetical protein